MLFMRSAGGAGHWVQPYNVCNILSPSLPPSNVLIDCRCRCHAEFCYLCGVRWKNCQCAQWQEDRLVARAEQVVQWNPRPRAPEIEARQVRQAIEHLRTRHECDHTSWNYVRGPHACEECHYTLPQYTFECRQCRLQACNRCRRNRL